MPNRVATSTTTVTRLKIPHFRARREEGRKRTALIMADYHR
jgi:hypothetical protein